MMQTHIRPDIQAGARSVKSSYEPGMRINYDADSKRVVIAFRGRITVLRGTSETEADAIAAGESHCRLLGWVPADNNSNRNKHFRSLF